MAHLPPSTRCRVCASEHRDRIDALRAGGASYSSLGDRFGFSRDTIYRHTKHVSKERRAALLVGPAKVAELVTAATDESRSLLDYLTITRSVLFNQFLSAAEAGDLNGVGVIASRLISTLQEVGKLTGELRQISGLTINQTNNTLNLVTSPEFGKLAAGLLKIARANPGPVRESIIGLLRDLEGSEEIPSAPAPAMIEGSALECVAAE